MQGWTCAAAGPVTVITSKGRHCVDLTVFIRSEGTDAQSNQLLSSALYTSLMSDGTVHTKCMGVVNYLLCFLFPSHTAERGV